MQQNDIERAYLQLLQMLHDVVCFRRCAEVAGTANCLNTDHARGANGADAAGWSTSYSILHLACSLLLWLLWPAGDELLRTRMAVCCQGVSSELLYGQLAHRRTCLHLLYS